MAQNPIGFQASAPLGKALMTLAVATWLSGLGWPAAWADTPPPAAMDMPPMCKSVSAAPKEGVELNEDCFEFGAAVGELGLGWRQKLPGQVRWLNRKDADSLCQQAESELGKQVDGRVPDGCVFLTPHACTIVTAGQISPAVLGNAVRHCVP